MRPLLPVVALVLSSAAFIATFSRTVVAAPEPPPDEALLLLNYAEAINSKDQAKVAAARKALIEKAPDAWHDTCQQARNPAQEKRLLLLDIYQTARCRARSYSTFLKVEEATTAYGMKELHVDPGAK